MSGRLRQALEQVARRFRRVRLWGGLAACWLVLALVGCAIVLAGPASGVGRCPPTGSWRRWRCWRRSRASSARCSRIRSARDPRWVARRIEAQHPELGTELLAAVDEVEAAPAGRLGFLQATVVREALEHRRPHDWDETVPTWQLRAAKLAHAACLVFLRRRDPPPAFGQVRSSAFGGPAAARGPTPPRSRSTPATPRSSAAARCWSSPASIARAPADANLVLEGDAQGHARGAMTRSLEDPTFAGRVESVESDLAYRVEFDGRSTDDLSRPRLRVSRAPAGRRPPRLPRLHRARAEGRRGHPPRHGRRGDRADPALPAQQGRRLGHARRRRRARPIAARPATSPAAHVYGRSSRSPTRGGSRSSWSTPRAGPTRSSPRSSSTSRGTARRRSR